MLLSPFSVYLWYVWKQQNTWNIMVASSVLENLIEKHTLSWVENMLVFFFFFSLFSKYFEELDTI